MSKHDPPWRTILERGALGVGVVLLAFYAAAMLHRTAGSKVAISSFEAAEKAASPAAAPAEEKALDFSLWSEKRIKAYRDSLPILQADPMALLAIDRLQIKAPVFAGTDELVLNRGVGWIPGTAKLGAQGNAGVAGHRDGFFRALKDVAVGDTIEVRTHQMRFTYRVDQIKIVFPENAEVLHPRGVSTLTLVTCYPFYFAGDAPQRFIVQAKLEEQAATNSLNRGGFHPVAAASLIQGVVQ